MMIRDTAEAWWKSAVIYCLDVETYQDWNDDGTGDFAGLIQRLDHLADLGVTCLWLMPFYPTADRDDGYDVTDYFGVDRRLGNLGDLVEAVRTARDRGLRVIADLVINHTSDRHPWFLSARRSPNSPYRDYYIWRDDEPPPTQDETMFPDAEDGIWTFDETAQAWYQHRFYRHQPDLNTANAAVRDAIFSVVGFWAQQGLSGFRVDAVPYFVDGAADTPLDDLDHPHRFLQRIRTFLSRRDGEAILMGEVNLPYEEQLRFFGEHNGEGGSLGGGGELDLQFDFNLNQAMYLALARRSAGPIVGTLAARPDIPEDAQWAVFVRNHDELTLDKLTDAERDEVFAAFGPDEDMQVFGRGLRRRLPPMLEGDPRRVRMVYSLAFTLPGTPVLFYGEEIGMGENLEADGRHAVRTPMQWTPGKNGGFSRAAPSRMTKPVTSGAYGPEMVNVADQRRDPDSLLSFVSMLTRRYRECPELGWARRAEILDQPHEAVLAHRMTWQEASMVAVHNLGPEPVVVPLRLRDCDEGFRLVDVLEHADCAMDAAGAVEIALEGYGFRWLRVVGPDDRRLL